MHPAIRVTAMSERGGARVEARAGVEPTYTDLQSGA
jgi:hypothetical protein